LFIDNLMAFVDQGLNRMYEHSFVTIVFTLFLVVAAYTDIKTLKIPDRLNILFFLSRLAFIPIMGFALDHLIGAFIGFVSLFIPAMVKMHKMGGDIKIATIIGLFAGLAFIPAFLMLAILYQFIFTWAGFAFGKRYGMLPFAPFFLASHLTWIAIYYMNL
jgi:prepilin signal peptidase PulO-like enzyme (type II secretory pathway)